MISKIKDFVKANFKKYFWYFIVFLAGILLCGMATHCDVPTAEAVAIEQVINKSELVWHSMITPYGPAYVYGNKAGTEFVAMTVFCTKHKGWHIAWIAADGLMTIDDFIAPTADVAKEFIEDNYNG